MCPVNDTFNSPVLETTPDTDTRSDLKGEFHPKFMSYLCLTYSSDHKQINFGS